MTAENDSYDRYRTSQVFTSSTANSSDSEAETYTPASPKTDQPKRNKRKNFKPRCSNVVYPDDGGGEVALNLSDFSSTNDNLNNNVRRRKTLATRRLVVDKYSPMDLSKTNDSDSNSETDDYNEDEANKIIPSSFSIHTLSKPHVSDGSGPHHQGQQISDMREYAMNTMRELLGIYGLTSEVAESISRQLPIAAFSSGKWIFYGLFNALLWLHRATKGCA